MLQSKAKSTWELVWFESPGFAGQVGREGAERSFAVHGEWFLQQRGLSSPGAGSSP